MRHTLPKSEVLRGFGSFTRVITEGKALSAPPLRCYYRRSIVASGGVIVGFSVSRGIRRATDRNRAKRLMRESYRLHKGIFTAETGGSASSVEMVFMFAGQTSALRGKNSFRDISQSMNRLMMLVADEER